jgi:mono/diheme cytochrome c family protein
VRYFLFILGLATLLTMGVLGRQGSMSRKPPIELFPDMDRQPKLRPQTPNDFFADQHSSRLPVDGTIARSQGIDVNGQIVLPFEENPLNTGKIVGTTNFIELNPLPVSKVVMDRGQQRFQINCSPCHGALGDGKGITTKYGMAVVGNLHDPRIAKQADGEIFNTITSGKNLMGAYGANVTIEDRWAIIYYVRALQLSRVATIDDVPAQFRAQITNPLPAAARPAAAQPAK